MKKVLGWLSKRVPVEEVDKSERKLFVKSFTLNEADEVEEVIEYLRLGTTIALLKMKSPSVTFKAVKRVKEFCGQIGGEVIGLSGNLFMAVPKNVEIVKKQPQDHFVEEAAKKEEIAEEVNEIPDPNEEAVDEEAWVDMTLEAAK